MSQFYPKYSMCDVSESPDSDVQLNQSTGLEQGCVP